MTRRTVSVVMVAALLLVLASGAVMAKNINGTAKNDSIEGTPNADRISGRAGDDYVKGLAGPDELIGGQGKDWLNGDAGDDTLWGGRGYDRVVGGDGDDTLAANEMVGGPGEDGLGFNLPGTVSASGGDGNDRIGVDDFHNEADSTPDTVECSAGHEDRVKANSDDTVADDCEIVEQHV